MQVDDVGILGKGHHNIGDGGADVADHDAADDQNAHALHAARHGQHKQHGSHGSGKGSQNQGEGVGEQAAVQKHHHRQRHGQLGPAGNAHDERPGNGVGKKRLQQIPGHRERRPQQHDHDGARQAQLQQDVGGQYILPAAQQGLRHVRAAKVPRCPRTG